jgi:hypothetical protein
MSPKTQRRAPFADGGATVAWAGAELVAEVTRGDVAAAVLAALLVAAGVVVAAPADERAAVAVAVAAVAVPCVAATVPPPQAANATMATLPLSSARN